MKALKLTSLAIVSSVLVSCSSPTEPASGSDNPARAAATPTLLPRPPTLLSPPDGAVLDNGCNNPRTDSIVWEFDWSDVPGATRYHLIVEHVGATLPAINIFTASSS